MARRIAALFALVLVVGAAPAHALGPTLELSDDQALIGKGVTPAEALQTVKAWHALGVDTVRVFVQWDVVAPGNGDPKMPGGFHPADPNDPKYDWGPLDTEVGLIRANGMQVMFDITGPGPLWTSEVPSKGNMRYKPSPSKFAQFATAVATRYRGEIQSYVIWNEPNEPLWLQPQATCTKATAKHKSVCTPASPTVFRNLVRASYPAIKAADPGVPVIIGGLAPKGQTSAGSGNEVLRPLAFLRDMGCVSTTFKPIRTGVCKGFQPAKADGIAYHPYGVGIAPTLAYRNPDDANLASLGHIEQTLDRIQATGGLIPTTKHFNLYLDEYGYQTDPPDMLLGVSPAAQDLYLQEGAYMAWHDPRVKLFSQYLWLDEPCNGPVCSGFQSGLRYVNGTPKPALAHFATPIFLDVAHKRLWGQERPGGQHTIMVQRRAAGSGQWKTIATIKTDPRGYWTTSSGLVKGASYRFTDGSTISGTVTD